jgi:hypothetical protein
VPLEECGRTWIDADLQIGANPLAAARVYPTIPACLYVLSSSRCGEERFPECDPQVCPALALRNNAFATWCLPKSADIRLGVCNPRERGAFLLGVEFRFQ